MEEARSVRLARLVPLLHLEHRTRLDKSRQWAQERDQGGLLSEPLVKPAHESMKERAVGDHLAKLTEFVANGLDALTEDADGSIALGDGAELSVEGGNTSVAVVLEQPTKLGPNVASGRAVGDHQVEELSGDARVQPLDDGEVILEPPRVLRDGGELPVM